MFSTSSSSCILLIRLALVVAKYSILWNKIQVLSAMSSHRCSESPYFSPGRSRTEAEISAASGHSFSTSSRGPHRDLLKPRKDFFTEHKKEEEAAAQVKTKKKPKPGMSAEASSCFSLTFEPVLEAVLHHHKELLQRRVVRVQRASEAQRRLDQTFDAQLGHVQQVGALHRHGVSHGCRENAVLHSVAQRKREPSIYLSWDGLIDCGCAQTDNLEKPASLTCISLAWEGKLGDHTATQRHENYTQKDLRLGLNQ